MNTNTETTTNPNILEKTKEKNNIAEQESKEILKKNKQGQEDKHKKDLKERQCIRKIQIQKIRDRNAQAQAIRQQRIQINEEIKGMNIKSNNGTQIIQNLQTKTSEKIVESKKYNTDSTIDWEYNFNKIV
jgi:hypothetical protein